MADDSLSGAAGLPAALSAFLRGAERRAFVFLWLQGGDPAAAERALSAAIRAFPGPAAAMPMAEWPTRFWKLLAALPVPHDGPGDWPPGLEALATMPAPVRQALLLRQVAGLDEAEAAALLGVEPAAYQALLGQACPTRADGGPDAAGWRLQAEAIQQAGRGLETPQLVRLAQLREAALSARPVLPAARDANAQSGPPSFASTGRGREPGRYRWLAWLAALVLLVAIAVVAVAWLSTPAATVTQEPNEQPRVVEAEDFRVHDHAPVRIEPLPQADPVQAATWPEPLQETAEADPRVAGLALLSWYAAGAPASAIEREAAATGGVEATVPATSDADPAADADDWARLDPAEQERVAAAAVALAAEEPQARAALRARFAALDAMERRGWRLGPVLGADYPALQPLLGFVSPGERDPLLDALRGLTPGQRARLAALAQRTPPADRTRLRDGLLAQAPERRGAWLEERAAAGPAPGGDQLRQ